MIVSGLRRLVALPRAELVALAVAQLGLLHTQLLVWTRPSGALLAPASKDADEAGAAFDARADMLAAAVSRAARYGVFRPKCLVRALTLHRWLERHGVQGSRVRLGVRHAEGRLVAHAWVEYHGRILADSERHVGSYTALPDVRLAGAR